MSPSTSAYTPRPLVLWMLVLATCDRAGGGNPSGHDADRGPCDALIACVAQAEPLALSEVASEFGEAGACWGATGDASLCRDACAQALLGYGTLGGHSDCPDFTWFPGAWEGTLSLVEKRSCRGFNVATAIPVRLDVAQSTTAGVFDFEVDVLPDGSCWMNQDGACEGSGDLAEPPTRFTVQFRDAGRDGVYFRSTAEDLSEASGCFAAYEGTLAPDDGVNDTWNGDTGS